MDVRVLKDIFITELCYQMVDGRIIKAYIIKSKGKKRRYNIPDLPPTYA
jgi:hypothetical protein|tara:strand:- start:371 stop:517 length:147 start_codon:yes stop_codon:yes gene_type:complete